MPFMAEYEVEDAVRRFDPNRELDTPNLYVAAQCLQRLVEWTNANSDGWPYWHKPSNAAKGLQQLLTDASRDYFRGHDPVDLTDAQLRAALRPIKAFLTRQNVPPAVKILILEGGVTL